MMESAKGSSNSAKHTLEKPTEEHFAEDMVVRFCVVELHGNPDVPLRRH